jgi:hypothetical protein
MVATEIIPATVYGEVAGEWQVLGKVELRAELLHYYPTDRIPKRVLEQAKRGLLAGHDKFRFTLAGIRYRVVGPIRPKEQVRNALTGVPVWNVMVRTNKGERVLEFEAPTEQDAREGAEQLKLTVVEVGPKC